MITTNPTMRDNILLVDHLLVVQLQGSEVLPCLRELALLHALAHEPEESKKWGRGVELTWVVEPKLTKSTEVQINSPVNESPLGIHQVKLVVKSEMIEVGYQMIFEFKKRLKYLNLLNHLEHFRPQDSIKHINQKVKTLVPPCPSLHDRRGVGEAANRPGGQWTCINYSSVFWKNYFNS